jgi:YidC/Oxa1 family membrane protein insertase
MNRTEKLIVGLLFFTLLAWLWHSNNINSKEQAQAAAARRAAATNTTMAVATAEAAKNLLPTAQAELSTVAPAPVAPALHLLPEETRTLQSAEMHLQISSRGATLRSATLPTYRAHAHPNKLIDPVVLDFAPQSALALTGLPDVPADADYSMTPGSNNSLVLTFVTPLGLRVERTITLRQHHQVLVTDRFANTAELPIKIAPHWLSLGTMYRGHSKNDELSADTFAIAPEGKVRHWSGELPALFGVSSFGCGAGRPLADTIQQSVTGAQHWVALKSRFFVQTFAPDSATTAMRIEAARDPLAAPFALSNIQAAVSFPGALLTQGESIERRYELYIGPKKLSYLQELGQRRDEIMEFGFFAWFCKPLVPLLNFFYRVIPNYGVAIILLTLLVRIIFWPLTHKSTESAKRMRDVQPKIKAIQEQFKDEPHKLQHEIWRVYKEHKVNPFSSCLPMLVQIPVFIALYTVLRSAVELRFAPFLWVADLSEPENLFAGVLPFSLNILPLAMAAVTIVQSKLTPAMGDPMQQKMMTWMMPLMMLFFFYSMPAALSLYWTISTILAIAQLWWQQRTPRTEAEAILVPEPEKMTRQMRRRMER